jgi:hypothetical protein
MRYGRFTDMSREDVIAYFEGNGFAVNHKDTTDELRAAAHIDCPEPVNDDTDPGPFFRVYQVAHMNEKGPGGVPVTLATMWTVAMTLGDKDKAEREVLRRNRIAMASGGSDRRIWRVRERVI